MTLIMVDLDREEDKIISYYKIDKRLVSKEEAIKRIIKEWGKIK
jgi:hypothetical protein